MKCSLINVFLFILLLVTGCKNSQKTLPEKPAVTEVQEPVFDCFDKVDTAIANSLYTKACHNTAYQRIDDLCVLAISYSTPTRYDSCIHVIIDKSDSLQPAQLFIYKEGKANILSFCNDYGSDAPIRTLSKASGDMYIRFSRADTSKESAPHNFKVSIWVNHLRFDDAATNGASTINQVLFFNVPNWTWFAG